jgi:hypothetical protein
MKKETILDGRKRVSLLNDVLGEGEMSHLSLDLGKGVWRVGTEQLE